MHRSLYPRVGGYPKKSRPPAVFSSQVASLLTVGLYACLALVVVGVPLAMRAVPLFPGPAAFHGMTHGTRVFDLFHGFKAFLVGVLGPLALVISILLRLLLGGRSLVPNKREPHLDRPVVGVAPAWILFTLILLTWILLTTFAHLLGPYPDLIWRGGLTQFDGLGVSWSYACLWLVGLILRRPQGNRVSRIIPGSRWCLDPTKLFPLLLALATGTTFVIGISELLGFSLAKEPWFSWLVIPAALRTTVKVEQVLMGAVSGTLGNPNYVAFYGALLVPFWASFAVTTRGLWRLASGLLLTMALVIAMGSGGVGGSFAWILSTVVLIFLVSSHARLVPWIKGSAVLVIVGGLSWGVVAGFNPQFLTPFKIKSAQVAQFSLQSTRVVGSLVVGWLSSRIFAKNPNPDTMNSPWGGGPKTTFLDGERLVIEDWEPGLMMEEGPEGLRLMDLFFRPLVLEKNGHHFLFKDPTHRDFTLTELQDLRFFTMGIRAFELKKGSRSMVVGHTSVGLRVLSQHSFIKPVKGRRLNLPLDDHLLSNRVFIWLRVLPLVWDRWLMGHGNGGFMLDFPNRDFRAMESVFGPHVFIDRPHNMYLQSLYGGGILGTALFAVLLFGGIFRGLRNFIGRPTQGGEDRLTLALSLGLLGASVAGLAYDLTVAYGGTFWLMLGLLHGGVGSKTPRTPNTSSPGYPADAQAPLKGHCLP